MGNKRLIISIILLFCTIFNIGQTKAQYKVIGYLTNWGNLYNDALASDADKLTHVCIAFFNPISTINAKLSGTINHQTVDYYHKHHVKVLASIGGANANGPIWKELLKPANRGKLIDSMYTFLKNNNLDGFDMD